MKRLSQLFVRKANIKEGKAVFLKKRAKMLLFLIFVLLAGGVCLSSCGDDDCTKVNTVILNDDLQQQMDSVFSPRNPIWAMVGFNDTLFTINDKQMFLQFCNDTALANNINLDRHTIVFCKIYTSSGSDIITSKELLQCDDNYEYDVAVKKCKNGCWENIGVYGYWSLYPKISSNIKLNKIEQ